MTPPVDAPRRIVGLERGSGSLESVISPPSPSPDLACADGTAAKAAIAATVPRTQEPDGGLGAGAAQLRHLK